MKVRRESVLWMSAGRVFQSWGAEWVKALFSHGAEVDKGHGEVDRGGKMNKVGRGGDVQEIRSTRRG